MEEVRTLGEVNTEALRAAVLAVSETWWYDDQYRQQGTQVAKASQSIRLTGREGLWWTRFEAVVAPMLADLQTRWYPTDATLGKIVFSRLLPHTKIALHTDHEPDQATLHRVHVPLCSNDAAILSFTDAYQRQWRQFHLRPGLAYEIRSELPHLAFNKGSTSRIHLVCDFHYVVEPALVS